MEELQKRHKKALQDNYRKVKIAYCLQLPACIGQRVVRHPSLELILEVV
jgi:hypothetical protein